MQVDMNVETREAVGKGVARTLRQQGKIPGVLYGQGECISLTIDPAEIRKVLHSESGSNTLLNVRIAKGGKEIQRTAMLRDYQLDPVTGAILHADLFEIAMDKPIRVRVPVAVTDGTPVGVAEGGILQHNMRELLVECLPREIPAHILVDPTPLKINQGIHVKEVTVPPNVRILDDPDRMVVSVAAPISEAKLEALLATTPAGETAAEPELIGKAKGEEGRQGSKGHKGGEEEVAGATDCRSRQPWSGLRRNPSQCGLLGRGGRGGRGRNAVQAARRSPEGRGTLGRAGGHAGQAAELHEPQRADRRRAGRRSWPRPQRGDRHPRRSRSRPWSHPHQGPWGPRWSPGGPLHHRRSGVRPVRPRQDRDRTSAGRRGSGGLRAGSCVRPRAGGAGAGGPAGRAGGGVLGRRRLDGGHEPIQRET